MRRKFDSSRLYKFIRALVLLYAMPTILLGIYMWLTMGNYQLNMINRTDDCYKQDSQANSPRSSFMITYCDSFMKMATDQPRNADNFLFSGIAVLVVFYGSTFIYKYLFPIYDTNKH
jgi:hypothetical protein